MPLGRRAPRNRNRELIPAVAACDRAKRQLLPDDLADRPHRFSAGQMAVLVVQRLQAIDVEDEQRHRGVFPARRADDRRQMGFERTEIVQTGEIVGQGQLAQAVGIKRELRGDDADGDEQSDLDKVLLAVSEREQVGIRQVIQENRGHGCEHAASHLEPEAGEHDWHVVQMLHRCRAGGSIENEDEQQGDGGQRRRRLSATNARWTRVDRC